VSRKPNKRKLRALYVLWRSQYKAESFAAFERRYYEDFLFALLLETMGK